VAPGSTLSERTRVLRGSDVLFVGDSHTLICGGDVAYPDCDIDARVGRDSTEAADVVERLLRPRHKVIVWEIATNDVIVSPSTHAANLERLRPHLSTRQLVMVNTWRGDADYELVNGRMAAFAADHPERASIVDWAAHVVRVPGAVGLEPDHVHFIPDAYRLRIELVSDAIEEARRRASG
jgi:hypothetical protein